MVLVGEQGARVMHVHGESADHGAMIHKLMAMNVAPGIVAASAATGFLYDASCGAVLCAPRYACNAVRSAV